MKWLPDKVQNLISVVFLILIAVLGLPTYLYVNGAHTKQLVADKGQALHDLARAAAAVISENLRERSREVELLTQAPLYVRADLGDTDIKASLARLQKSYPHYSWIGVVDLEGQVRAATGNLLVGQNVVQRPWFQQARNGLYVGDLHEARLLSPLLAPQLPEWPIRFIDFAAPLRDGNGRIRGVLGVHVHWTWSRDLLQVILPETSGHSGIELFIVNRNRDLIYPEAMQTSGAAAPRLAQSESFGFHSWGGKTNYLTAAVSIKDPVPDSPLAWQVMVRQPEQQVLAEVTSLQRMITSVLLGAMLLFALLTWLLGRAIGRPIRELSEVAQAIARGESANFPQQVPTRELQRLAGSLCSMARNLLANQRDLEALNRDLESRIAERTRQLTDANQALVALARQDALTGLSNRLAADEWLLHEFKLLKRTRLPYAVLVLDIDFFKKVNDSHGHAVGDAVLRHVAALLKSAVRTSDFISRMGGEEFLVIMPLTTFDDALRIAEKLRAVVEAAMIDPVGRVTLSIGIAMADPEDAAPDTAIQKADEMLYAAKTAGRNRVMPCGPERGYH